MRSAILLGLLSLVLLSQTSCGVLAHQANRAKHIMQWPFRAGAELDSRYLKNPSESWELLGERDLWI